MFTVPQSEQSEDFQPVPLKSKKKLKNIKNSTEKATQSQDEFKICPINFRAMREAKLPWPLIQDYELILKNPNKDYQSLIKLFIKLEKSCTMLCEIDKNMFGLYQWMIQNYIYYYLHKHYSENNTTFIQIITTLDKKIFFDSSSNDPIIWIDPKEHNTVIIVAARMRDKEIFDLIFNIARKYIKVHLDLWKKFLAYQEINGYSALNAACWEHDLNAVSEILKEANDIFGSSKQEFQKFLESYNNDGFTPLNSACFYPPLTETEEDKTSKIPKKPPIQLDQAIKLLTYIIDYSKTIYIGETYKDYPDFITSKTNKGFTPLLTAVSTNFFEAVNIMVQEGIETFGEKNYLDNFINIPNSEGFTPIKSALRLGYKNLIDFLCDLYLSKIDLYKPDKFNKFYFHILVPSINYIHKDSKTLLEKFLSFFTIEDLFDLLSIKDAEGNPFLYLVIRINNEDNSLQYLKNIQSLFDNCNTDYFRILLNQKNYYKKSAFDMARSKNYSTICKEFSQNASIPMVQNQRNENTCRSKKESGSAQQNVPATKENKDNNCVTSFNQPSNPLKVIKGKQVPTPDTLQNTQQALKPTQAAANSKANPSATLWANYSKHLAKNNQIQPQAQYPGFLSNSTTPDTQLENSSSLRKK